jgi:hypothetical protein
MEETGGPRENHRPVASQVSDKLYHIMFLWYGSYHEKVVSLHPEVVVAVIVWQLDLQQPMQSVHITTDVVGLNLKKGEVYNIMW